MTQSDFFGMDSQPLCDTPRARRSDPATSHEAAEAIKANGTLSSQQRRALELVKRFPGRTCWELAEIEAREKGGTPERHERWIGRRLPELCAHVCASDAMSKVVRGRRARTWWPK